VNIHYKEGRTTLLNQLVVWITVFQGVKKVTIREIHTHSLTLLFFGTVFKCLDLANLSAVGEVKREEN
jgi:hypothetical protein